MAHYRRLPVGAEVAAEGTHFRVWAPARRRVDVVVGDRTEPLEAQDGGYFAGFVRGMRAGATYRYRIDGDRAVPDPASRFQPQGPHGPSMVIDPGAYRWADAGWGALRPTGLVLYEMHVGTFTAEGTLASALRELSRLAELGVTAVELMPVAEFAGEFGWGYDGVDLFAPSHLYGEPDDLRRFVDTAHALGIGVLLDVVYNHFGPDGCYLRELSPSYFTTRYASEWGDAINFDGDDAGPVRELFVANAGYWIEEFHMGGLRLDATPNIHDSSPRHVLAEISERARSAAGGRAIVLVAEDESQRARLVRPSAGGGSGQMGPGSCQMGPGSCQMGPGSREMEQGYGLSAVWNDDFHHSAIVAATGRGEAYYSDHAGTPQELLSAVKRGFLFQGQRYGWQKKGRGSVALDLPACAFVHFLENHDQVANTSLGTRLCARTSPARHRALVALLLLGPQTPMLFQGEELGSTAPFLFFADHAPELAAKVREGRAAFLAQFPATASPEMQRQLAEPSARRTFERCKLDPRDGERNGHVTALYRDLLQLRRSEPAFAQQRADRLDGAVLGPEAFVLRFFCDASDRLVLVNLGAGFRRGSLAEPLIAPPGGGHWRTVWSSEDPRYGGEGVGPVDDESGWRIAGHQTTVLAGAP